MPMSRAALTVLACACAGVSCPSLASPMPADGGPFAGRNTPLADAELVQVAGGFEDGRTFSRATVAVVLDGESRAAFRNAAAIAGSIMDAWWFEEGTPLIAANLVGSR